MSVDQLIDAIWEEAPPRTARKNLQAYVSMLRKIVGERLVHTAHGYSMRCTPAELDILAFEEMAARGREAARSGAPGDAADALAGALRLWRGTFLADVPHSAFLAAMAARLADRRLRIYEDWSEAAIALGEYREVLDTIDELADAHPERDRLTAVKLVALCQCGRRQEALGYYESIRVRMASDLGLDPSPQLQRLFQAMLSGEPVGLDAGRAEAHGAAGPGAAGLRGKAEPQSKARLGPGGAAPPARRAGGARPTEGSALPRDVADFTGRAREIGTIIESLCSGADGPAGVLVTGPVGTGKTALAVHVAHLMGSRFGDGQPFVPMRDTDRRQRSAVSVLAGLATMVGADIDPSAPDAAAAWRAWLSRRNLLIVLDDARDETAVRALLPGGGRSRVLVTSRYRLSGIETLTRVELGGFSRTEAVQLAAKIAGFDSVLGEPGAIVSRIERCGRLPLAVRILAGRFNERADPVPQAGQDMLGQLTLGDLNLPRRYREHLGELADEDRRVLGLLVSRLRPPYAAADIAQVLADSRSRAWRARAGSAAVTADSVEALVEANLLVRPDDEVTAHSDRYSMPALAYEFARATLAGPDPAVSSRPQLASSVCTAPSSARPASRRGPSRCSNVPTMWARSAYFAP